MLNIEKFNITFARKVKVKDCNLTSTDWQLYSSLDCSDAVAEMNKAVVKYCNTQYDRRTATEHIEKIMYKYKHLGAADTEPRCIKELILDAVFGKEE